MNRKLYIQEQMSIGKGYPYPFSLLTYLPSQLLIYIYIYIYSYLSYHKIKKKRGYPFCGFICSYIYMLCPHSTSPKSINISKLNIRYPAKVPSRGFQIITSQQDRENPFYYSRTHRGSKPRISFTQII